MVMKFIEKVKEDSWSSVEWPGMYTNHSFSKLAIKTFTTLQGAFWTSLNPKRFTLTISVLSR